MNDDPRDTSLLVVVSCCLLIPALTCSFLLLPVVVTLSAEGIPAHESASRLITSTPAVASLGQAPTLATEQAVGNAANGQQLFNAFQPAAGIACSTCHRVDSEERLVGPGLLNVGIR